MAQRWDHHVLGQDVLHVDQSLHHLGHLTVARFESQPPQQQHCSALRFRASATIACYMACAQCWRNKQHQPPPKLPPSLLFPPLWLPSSPLPLSPPCTRARRRDHHPEHKEHWAGGDSTAVTAAPAFVVSLVSAPTCPVSADHFCTLCSLHCFHAGDYAAHLAGTKHHRRSAAVSSTAAATPAAITTSATAAPATAAAAAATATATAASSLSLIHI